MELGHRVTTVPLLQPALYQLRQACVQNVCCMNSSFQWLKFLVASRLTSKDRTFSFWKFDSIWMMYDTCCSMAMSIGPLPTGQFGPRARSLVSMCCNINPYNSATLDCCAVVFLLQHYGTAKPKYPSTSFSQASRRLCPSCLQ